MAEALKVGMWVRDNDPRMDYRPAYEVVAIVDGKAHLRDRSTAAKVSLGRIHLDGKPRRSGWSATPPPQGGSTGGRG